MNSSGVPPSERCRPLQFTPPFEQWCGTTDEAIRANLQRLRDLGMGGIVLTVSLDNYLCSEAAWEVLRRGCTIAAGMGFRIWIYDEKGYPSGAAGGLVLDQRPEGEAQGLVRVSDGTGISRYETVRLYEGTHATENFYQKRPYINILDAEVVSAFLQVTHEQYAATLHPLENMVEAFFTDEPSLIAAYIPREKTYPPTIPWHPRLPEEFQARKGYDLVQHLGSLFGTTGRNDRRIRCDFYEVIGDLCAETYFGPLQEWCHNNNVLSSGHLLGEETLVWQTLFEGDPFACYARMDIPGIDMILSDPEKVMDGNYFLVPKLGSSASRLQGKRRLMCEISDFLGMQDAGHASLDQMRSTASILSALGVTDFVSMYQPPLPRPPGVVNESWPDPAPLSEGEFKAYADFVARVNALFSEGTIQTRIAVLHPLLTIWAHFTPSDRSMYDPHPNAHLESVDRAFTTLCRDLLQRQMDFDIVDDRSLAHARSDGGNLIIGEHRYEALVLPPMDTVRVGTMEAIARFAGQGGFVLSHGLIPRFSAGGMEEDERVRQLVKKFILDTPHSGASEEGVNIADTLQLRIPRNCDLVPGSSHILCTFISRNEGPAYFLVNTGRSAFKGLCTFRSTGEAILFDPATGQRRNAELKVISSSGRGIALSLAPYQSLFVIFGPSRTR